MASKVIPQPPEEVDLEIHAGEDLSFDVEWYEVDEETGIPIASIESQVRRRSDGEVLLDLAEYATIAAHIVHINVPAAVTAALPAAPARWDLDATATGSGQVKKLARGRALIRSEISVPEVP